MKSSLGLCLALGVLVSQAALAQGPLPPLASVIGAPFSGVRSQQAAKSFVDGNRIDRGGNVRLYRDGRGRTRVERVVGAADPDQAPRRSRSATP